MSQDHKQPAKALPKGRIPVQGDKLMEGALTILLTSVCTTMPQLAPLVEKGGQIIILTTEGFEIKFGFGTFSASGDLLK